MRCAARAIALFALLLLGLSGCASPASKPPPPATATDALSRAPYHIGVDDLVQVSVWRNPDLSVTVPVRPDGMISVPLIGDVQAGGHTPEEVAATIQEKLSAYVRDPKVAVILSELRSHEFISRVRITGAVRNPTSLPYRQGMTVLDVVLAAGGINQFASPDQTMLYRKKGNGTESFRIHLGRMLNRGDLSTNYTLQPGDVVTVPERAF